MIRVNSEPVALRATGETDRSDRTTDPAAALAPVRPPAPDSRFYNRDVSMMLALAIAGGVRELSKMQRDSARMMIEGELALLTAMMRAEPQLVAMMEDVQFIKNMISSGVQIAMQGAQLAQMGKAAFPKMPSLDLGKPFEKGAAHAASMTGLDRVTAIRDELVLNSEHARYVFAKNRAETEAGAREFRTPEDRKDWIHDRTEVHAKQLYEGALERRAPAVDLKDWPLNDRQSRARFEALLDHQAVQKFGKLYHELPHVEQQAMRQQVGRSEAVRAIYGDQPTPQQEALVEDAMAILRSDKNMFTQRWEPLGRDAFADQLESFRPFGVVGAKRFDSPDGRALIDAVRDRRVDLTVELQNDAGRVHPPWERIGVGQVLFNVEQFTEGLFDDGWNKDLGEVPAGIQGINQVDREMLDTWYALFLEARLECMQWSSRFADIFADVADINMVMRG